MIKNNEYIFHNPNSENDTINFLIKLIANTAVEKILNNAYKISRDPSNNPDCQLNHTWFKFIHRDIIRSIRKDI